MSHTAPSHESGHAVLPTRRKFLRQAAVGALAGGVLAAGGWVIAKRRANLWQVQRERALMGTSVSITALADDREAAAAAIDAAFAHMLQHGMWRLEPDDIPFEKLHPPRRAQRLHPRDVGWRRAEFRGTVHQHQAARSLDQRQRPVDRRVAASRDHELATVELRCVGDLVVHRSSDQRGNLRQVQRARCKRAESAGDDHDAGIEFEPAVGRCAKAPGLGARERGHGMAKMEDGCKRADLLLQALDQLARGAHRKRRDVIDRLVGIQLGALAANDRHRIDDVCG
jgi:hypothetical protein